MKTSFMRQSFFSPASCSRRLAFPKGEGLLRMAASCFALTLFLVLELRYSKGRRPFEHPSKGGYAPF